MFSSVWRKKLTQHPLTTTAYFLCFCPAEVSNGFLMLVPCISFVPYLAGRTVQKFAAEGGGPVWWFSNGSSSMYCLHLPVILCTFGHIWRPFLPFWCPYDFLYSLSELSSWSKRDLKSPKANIELCCRMPWNSYGV